MFIGISDIVEYDNNSGYFSSNKDLLSEVKSNIKNWILTNPGERISMPDWGFGPDSFIFSPQPQNVADQMQAKIRDGFATWFPFVKINSIKTDINEQTIRLTLNLTFRGKEFTLEQVLKSIT